MCGSDIFHNCSEQSVDNFFEDLGKCNRIRKLNFDSRNDLAEIMRKLEPVIRNNNITHWSSDACDLGDAEANNLSNVFRDMKGLEELSITCDDDDEDDLNDGIMAGCIPSLAACTGMRKLALRDLNISTNSCTALSAVFPEMSALQRLDLCGNSIDHDCAEDLVNGLGDCEHLHRLDLRFNMNGDDGLEMLIQGLPASVDSLDLGWNEIALARQLPLLKFKVLYLSGNSLSPGGPRVITASLAEPECRLEELYLYDTPIGDEGAATLATSMPGNQRLTHVYLDENNITKTGLNAAFSAILCDTTSINATHGSNHTLQFLGSTYNLPSDVKMWLQLNSDQDKSRVAAKKILQTHRHLDMKPLFDRQLDLLPRVVTWLDRFAVSRLNLKLSSIHEFVRAMPMEVVEGMLGKNKGKKRRRSSSNHGRH